MQQPGRDRGILSPMPTAQETPQPPWLLSFGDFISCVLACFVLLYSLVAVDKTKLNKILEGMPGRQVMQTIPTSAAQRAMQIAPEQDARNADYLTSVLGSKLEHDPALAGVTVEGQGDRVLLHLPVKDLLSTGQSGTPAGERLIHALGGALGTLPNSIAVEVRPDRPADFASGLGYAVTLARRLEEAGAVAPVAARARLTAPGEAAGIVLIVFDTAPATAGSP